MTSMDEVTVLKDETTVTKGRGGYVRTIKPGGSVMIGESGVIVTVLATGKAVKEKREITGEHSRNRKRKRGGNRIRLLFSGLPDGMRVTECKNGGAKPVFESELVPDGETVKEESLGIGSFQNQERPFRQRYAHRGPLQLLL